jgi:hypothetical protein
MFIYQRVIIQIHPMIIQMWPHLGSYGQQERRTALAIRGLGRGQSERVASCKGSVKERGEKW